MKLYTYRTERNTQRIGVLKDGVMLLDLEEAERLTTKETTGHLTSMQSLIEGGEESLDMARQLLEVAPEGALLNLQDLHILSPLPVPVRLRDASFFLEHLEMISREMKKLAITATPASNTPDLETVDTEKFELAEVFYRRVLYYNGNHHAVIGHEAPIKWPLDINLMDYELEFATVIGRGGYDISPDEAEDHVFGYTLMNDWSARDLQVDVYLAGAGPCMGKDLGTSLGPCIVTRDEIPNPHKLEMTATVNGEEWSRGWTKNMYHNLFEGLSQISRIAPLIAGEVIGSGTPAKGSGLEQGMELRPGHLVELHMPEIGTLSNRVEK